MTWRSMSPFLRWFVIYLSSAVFTSNALLMLKGPGEFELINIFACLPFILMGSFFSVASIPFFFGSLFTLSMACIGLFVVASAVLYVQGKYTRVMPPLVAVSGGFEGYIAWGFIETVTGL